MKKQPPAASPDAYVASISGWRRPIVESLRTAVTGASKLDEVIKWGHIVYSAGGPVCLIRAEEARVLFGFWRGQRLLEIEPRLKAGGKYEMATLDLREGDAIAPAIARRLVKEAVRLNADLGDPTHDALPAAKKKTVRKKASKPSGRKGSRSPRRSART